MTKRIEVLLAVAFIETASPALAQTAAPAAHPYDPCAVVSKQDVASALGVAADQVFTPKEPTKNECYWAVAAHTGMPGQQAALTLQTIDNVKQAHGFAILAPVLQAVRQIPGAPVTNQAVNRTLDDAQAVANLGDRAGWKNSTLTVVKKEMLLQVKVDAVTDSESLKAAKAIAQSALHHLPEDK